MQQLLKRNSSTLWVVIFIILILPSAFVFAKDGVTREQWQELTAIQPSSDKPGSASEQQNKTKDENGDDSPFGFGQAETKSAPAATSEKPENDSKTPPAADSPAIDNSNTTQPANTANPQDNYKTGVLLQGLNKITARTSKLEVKIDQPIKFGNLSIKLHACWKSPPEEATESKALLEMWEEIPGESRKKIFSGWMFASSPLISAPEHPIYDITVLECTGEPVKH